MHKILAVFLGALSPVGAIQLGDQAEDTLHAHPMTKVISDLDQNLSMNLGAYLRKNFSRESPPKAVFRFDDNWKCANRAAGQTTRFCYSELDESRWDSCFEEASEAAICKVPLSDHLLVAYKKVGQGSTARVYKIHPQVNVVVKIQTGSSMNRVLDTKLQIANIGLMPKLYFAKKHVQAMEEMRGDLENGAIFKEIGCEASLRGLRRLLADLPKLHALNVHHDDIKMDNMFVSYREDQPFVPGDWDTLDIIDENPVFVRDSEIRIFNEYLMALKVNFEVLKTSIESIEKFIKEKDEKDIFATAQQKILEEIQTMVNKLVCS